MPQPDSTHKSGELQSLLALAESYASSRRHGQADSLHLLHACTRDAACAMTMSRAGCDLAGLSTALERALARRAQVDQGNTATRAAPDLVWLCDQVQAARNEDSQAAALQVIAAMLDTRAARNGVASHPILLQHGLDGPRFEHARRACMPTARSEHSPEDTEAGALARFCRDLTQEARDGDLDPVMARDRESRRMLQILARRRKNNPVLVGDAGVGKSAIVEGLAHRIVRGAVPLALQHARLYQLDLTALVAGAAHRGDFEQRLRDVLSALEDADTPNLLFIDEVHTLVGTGGAKGTGDAANLLKPALARGRLRCIGATTADEWRLHIETDKALERRFQPIDVAENTVDESLAILRGLRERFEAHHGLHIVDAAFVAAVELSRRFMPDRKLPDKAIDVIDEACARLAVEIDSMPSELETLEREIRQDEIEQTALRRDLRRQAQSSEDPDLPARLQQLHEQLESTRARARELSGQWQRERDAHQSLREAVRGLDKLRAEALEAETKGRLDEAAELIHGRMLALSAQREGARQQLEDLHAAGANFLPLRVDAHTVAGVVAHSTGIPVERLDHAAARRLLDLESELGRYVLGQSHAIALVASALRRSRAGLSDPQRPRASFLFLGPTGVGKTQLAKCVAEQVYDGDQALVRMDMSEFKDASALNKFIGAPPGYVGYESAGQLTRALRRRPHCVVLLDEIEKAHPEVLDALLQVLDDGRLTDGRGEVADFRHAVIIMTSNLITDARGLDESDLMGRLQASLRPEFINRIDDIVVFSPLDAAAMAGIVDIEVGELVARALAQGLKVTVDAAARHWLAQAAHDPMYGARPLRRLLRRELEDRLAELILSDESEHEWTVEVEVGGGGLRIRQTTAETAARAVALRPAS